MKKAVILAAALVALGGTAPAAAQSNWGNYANGYDRNGFEFRLNQLQERIQYGVERRTISRQEAYQLRDQLRQLNRLERQYGRNGLNRGERRDLQERIQYLQRQIQIAERDRGYGHDRNDRYDRDDDRRDRDDDRDDDRRGDRDD